MNIKSELIQKKKEVLALNWRIIIPIFLAVIVFDQLSKQYFDSNYIIHERHTVIPDFFWFTLHYNKGIAFGIRLFENQIIFVLFSLAAVIFIFFYLLSLEIKARSLAIIIGLIIGGAIGNIIDRAIFGQVIDFIEVEFPDIHINAFSFFGYQFDGFYMETWPIFNVADSAVSIGMVSILVLTTIATRKNKKEDDLNHASN